MILFKNAKYLDDDFRIRTGDIHVTTDRIDFCGAHRAPLPEDTIVDCQNYTLIPGMIDIHIHGCNGANICDGNRTAVDTMAVYLIQHGITSFCPTTVTTDIDTIQQALLAAKECVDLPMEKGASVLGVNLEGPFLAPGKIGAQKPETIQLPDFEQFQRLFALCGGIIKLVSVAPEQPGGLEFVKAASRCCTVSIAHTCAGYREAKDSFDCGVTHATHLFNAMSGLHHREPGVVGAVFDDPRVRAELICDGHHVHPAVLRIAFQLLGNRAVIVSDAMRAAGLPEGDGYEQGGQIVQVHDGKATLQDGTLAGSVTNLHSELKNLIAFGIPFEQAVRAATLTPAQAVGMAKELGSIQTGKRADLVLLDQTLEIASVYHNGRKVV